MPEFAWVEQNYGLGWWYAHLLSCRRRWSEVFERLDALARGMADVHTELCPSHLYAGQTMACILAERLAIRDLLAHPELQPLIVPNEDYGDAAQQTHPPAADHVGESEVVGQVYLSHAVQEWINAHCRGEAAWGVERRALCRVVLEQFIAACGDKSVSAYGKSDGRKFIALLRQLPPNLSKLPPRNGNLYATAAAAAKRGLSPPERPHRQQENWDCKSMFPLDHCALRRVLDEPRGRNEASYPPKREGGARTVYR